MSLKLGNTNIAGTQVLYSTTGNNTDGAMTQAVTTTQLNLKANDADVVHKTGNETISGQKNFKNDMLIKGSTSLDMANTPSSTESSEIQWKDKNNNNGGVDYLRHYTTGVKERAMCLYNGSQWNQIAIGINELNKFYTYAPASDVNNSIVTTVNKSKSENGYFKLGNGLIIQWGRSSTTDGYVSFPTPFSNACTAVIPTRISSGDAQSNICENASTTRFKVKIYGGYSSSSYFYWIAIGY